MFDEAPDPSADVRSASRLEVRGLSKRYASGLTTRLAFQGLNADFAMGAVTLLYGPNGAGKTSLLRCLAGIASSSSGGFWHAKNGVRTPPDCRYVPEGGRGFHAALSAGENLEWAARMSGTRDAIADLLKRLPTFVPLLSDRRPARALSRGQKQVLSIAMACLQRPEFYLFDEPTNGLDPKAEGEVVALLQTLRSEGAGIVVATHNLSLQASADMTLFMRAGRIVAMQAEGREPLRRCDVEVSDATVAFGAGFEPGPAPGSFFLIGSAQEILRAVRALDPETVNSLRIVENGIRALYLED